MRGEPLASMLSACERSWSWWGEGVRCNVGRVCAIAMQMIRLMQSTALIMSFSRISKIIQQIVYRHCIRWVERLIAISKGMVSVWRDLIVLIIHATVAFPVISLDVRNLFRHGAQEWVRQIMGWILKNNSKNKSTWNIGAYPTVLGWGVGQGRVNLQNWTTTTNRMCVRVYVRSRTSQNDMTLIYKHETLLLKKSVNINCFAPWSEGGNDYSCLHRIFC